MKIRQFIVFFFLFPFFAVFPQWKSTLGPTGANVNILAATSAGRLQVGTTQGVFVSSVTASAWRSINKTSQHNIRAILTEGQSIFTATKRGIFYSINNGKSWTVIQNPAVKNISINSLAKYHNRLYASTAEGTVLKLTQTSTSWTADNISPISVVSIHSLFISKRFIGKRATLFAATSRGILSYNSSTMRWHNSGLSNREVLTLNQRGANLFAGTSSGIYSSSDNGKSWIFKGLNGEKIYSISSARQIMFAATNSGNVFQSTDYGNTWKTFKNGLPLASVKSIIISGRQVFAGTSGKGVYKLDDYLINDWKAHNTGLVATNISAITSRDTHPKVIFSSTRKGGIFKTYDFLKWSKADKGLNKARILSLCSAPGKQLLAGTEGGLFVSSDDGNSWKIVGLANSRIYSLHHKNDSLFIGSKRGVFLAIYSAGTWRLQSHPLGSDLPRNTRILALANSREQLLAGTNKGLYSLNLSKISSNLWQLITDAGLNNATVINSLSTDENRVFAGTDQGIFSSQDNGISWTTHGLQSQTVKAIAIVQSAIIAGTAEGIWVSSINETNWKPDPDKLPIKSIGVLSICQNDLLAGTSGRGIYRKSTSLYQMPAHPRGITGEFTQNAHIKLQWSPASSHLDGYNIYRSTRPDLAFIKIKRLDASTTHFEDPNIDPNQLAYYYKISTFNHWGESDFSDVIQVDIPRVIVEYPECSPEGTDIHIKITPRTIRTTAAIDLAFRKSGDSKFTIIAAQESPPPGNFRIMLPGIYSKAPGIEFKALLKNAKNVIFKRTRLYYSGIMVNRATSAYQMPAGTTANAYRIFSIPLELTDTTATAFLNANPRLGNYDPTQFRWFGIKNGNLKEYPDIGNITPGNAFLFITQLEDLNLHSSSGKTLNTIKPFDTIHLSRGWHLIGNPYHLNIPHDSIQVSRGTFTMMSYEGSWQLNTRGMEPWKGYAVYVDEDTQLLIKPGISRLNQKQDFYQTTRQEDGNWLIQIAASTEETEDHFNFIGQHQEVLSNPELNIQEPPRLPGQVSLAFTTNDSEEIQTTDIRKPSQEGNVWEFLCRTDPNAAQLSLKFKGLNNIPEHFYAFLIDMDTHDQHTYSLTEHSTINVITAKHPTRQFKLLIGTKAFLEYRHQGIEFKPTRFELSQNFPNPFNPSTQITYTLPQSEHVTLKIYNSLGQLVTTLVDSPQKPGRYSKVWDARNIATGIYFYHIQAGNFNKIKKCLLIK